MTTTVAAGGATKRAARAVSPSTRKLRVSLMQNGVIVVASGLTNPSTFTVTAAGTTQTNVIPNVPAGSYSVVTEALDGSGAVIGVNVSSATVAGGLPSAVTVNEMQTVKSVGIAPSSATLAVGATQQESATATLSDNTTLSVTTLGSWASTENPVAIVSNQGLVTGVAAGAAVVSCTYIGVSGTANLTVGAGTPSPTPTPLVSTSPSPSPLPSPSPSPGASPSPAASPSPSPTFVWQEFGPKPQFDPVSVQGTGLQFAGRSHCILDLGSGANGDTLLVGWGAGGLWNSSNEGTTWTTTTAALNSLNFGALAVDAPLGAIFAGSGESSESAGNVQAGRGLFVSFDNGTTWAAQTDGSGNRVTTFDGLAISRIVVDPNDNTGKTILVATTIGWRGFNFVAATTTGWGLYRSTDGGKTFSLVLAAKTDSTLGGGAIDDMLVDPLNPKILYIAEFGVGIKKATAVTNFGDFTSGSFALVSLNSPPVDVGAITLCGASLNGNEEILALVGQKNQTAAHFRGVWGSSDGTTWNLVKGTNTSINTQLNYSGDFTSGYAQTIRIAQNAAGTPVFTTAFVGAVEAGRLDNIDISGVNASTLTELTYYAGKGSAHADIHQFQFDSSGNLLMCSDGGLYSLANPLTISPDKSSGINTWTSTWISLNGSDDVNGLNANAQECYGVALNATNSARALEGSQDCGTAFFGGVLHWTGVNSGDGGPPAIDPTNGNVMYTQANYSDGVHGFLQRSTDGGKNFSGADAQIDITQTGQFPGLPLAFAPNTGSGSNFSQMAMANTIIYETTTNTAASIVWAASSPQLLASSNCFNCLAYGPTPAVLYAGCVSGHVFVRTTQGGSFTDASTGLPGSGSSVEGLAVDPSNGANAIACVENNQAVWLTNNSGAQWKNISSNLPNVQAYSAVIDESTGSPIFYVGTEIGVYQSKDQGTSWSRFGTGLPNVAVRSLIEVTTLTPPVLAAGTYGRGMWEVSLNPQLPLSPVPAGSAPKPIGLRPATALPSSPALPGAHRH